MEQENKYGFEFPILAIHKYGISCARNMKQITTCTKQGLRNGFYNNLIIIDSNSRRYVVGSADKIAYAPFELKWWIFLNFRIIISLNILKVETIPFDETRKICKYIIYAQLFTHTQRKYSRASR